jgi:hypothetical protein
LDRETVSGIMLALLIFSLIGAYIIGVTAQETHDIAVVSVTPSLTSVRVGELVNITVVVENKGTNNETFDHYQNGNSNKSSSWHKHIFDLHLEHNKHKGGNLCHGQKRENL